MRKLLSISLIPIFAFFLFGAFAAFPADAQAPADSCVLVRDVNVKFGTKSVVDDGSTVGETTALTDATSDGSVIVDGSADEIALVETWGTVCLVNTINVIVDWVFILLLVVAVALIAIAGFLWMTGGTNPEQQKMAGNMIKGAIIGIIIAILARVLPALITGILL